MNDLARCVAFRRGFDERSAARNEPLSFGRAYSNPELPLVWSRNSVAVDLGARPGLDELIAEAELAQAALLHRRVSVDDAYGAELAPLLGDRGWTTSRLAVMVHRGVPPEVDVSATREVGHDAVAEAWANGHRSEEHGRDEEVVRQLIVSQHLHREVIDVRYFAAFDGDRVASYCELYSDGPTAQIESVMTLPAFRGRGHGKAVVARALLEACSSHDFVFIVADDDDWPKDLYAKLGFGPAGFVWEFTRHPSPLFGLKLRTPRLELRLPTRDEILELAGVAERGIHPRDEMPFQVPWTDWIGDDAWPGSFVEFHEQSTATVRPESWRLQFVTFLDGEPIGTQELRADRFAERRLVETGSWLGREFQRRGYGTEQREAALALAFDGLGARAAISGALEGNLASTRVSAKLGYVVTGIGSVAPRGTPVAHTDFRLDREVWVSRERVSVEIDGLEPCLALLL